MNSPCFSRHARARRSGGAVLLLCLWLLAACEVDDPCDPGQTYMQGLCFPKMTPPPPGPVDAGADDGAASDAGELKDTFGKTCASAEDCAGGNATVCAPAPFSSCTQQNCMDGEAHAGACPSGWRCLAIPSMPSACVNF